jgi:predicted phage tail protein
MKVVKVYGALRKYLGQCRFQFEADTPAQAIKALCVNFPGLDKWLLDSEQDGVAYRVTIGKEKIGEDDLSPLVMPWSEREVFSITPVIAGAGGVGKIIAGIGLIIVGAIVPGAQFLIGIGAGLAFSGVSQLISPTPTFSNMERGKEAARLESFTFSGITNTAQQGLPVPICYGRTYIGSAVISSGLDVDQLI